MTTPVAPGDARAALELAHAVVADAAATTGVRFLVLKGLGAQHHGLQDAARVPADVDVLVAPDGVGALTAELERRGWRRRAVDADDVTFSTHAVTLYRPGWGCDLDVHDRFPGFGPDAGAVFRCLWSRRSAIVVAGVVVAVPGREDAVLVHALHCLRGAGLRRQDAEYAWLLEHVAGDPGGDVTAAARSLGALAAARPFLEAAYGVELADWGTPDLRWRLLTAAPSPHTRRVLAVVEAPWRDRLRVLRVAVFPPRQTLEKRGLTRLGGRRLVSAYVRRLWRGLRLLPPAVWEARSLRHRG